MGRFGCDRQAKTPTVQLSRGAAAESETASGYLITQGYQEGDPLVLEARYNMAISYSNAGRYDQAHDILTAIRQVNPDYNPFLVSDQIERINRLMREGWTSR